MCLVWVLRDFHLMQELRQLANVNWKWVVLGMTCDVVSYGIQALRWKFLLAPFGKVRLTRSIRAVFSGLFANLVFPLRPGEVLRSYLLSNSEDITIGRVLGSVGVERFVDLVIATAALAVVSLFVELPRRFQRVADTLAIVTLVLLTFVALLILYLEIKLGSQSSFRRPATPVAREVHGGAYGPPRHGYRAELLRGGPDVIADAVLPGAWNVGHDAVLRAFAVASGRDGGAADHQSRRFASKCARERRFIPGFLRTRIERI